MGSRSIQAEVCSAIRSLHSAIPPFKASVQQRADYQIRKAEVLDLIAAVDPSLSVHARELAARARYEAQAIAASSETW